MIFAVRVILVLIAATTISVALVLLARTTQKRHKLCGTEDVETAYITAVTTLYGIFIAFMIFTVWTRYNEALEATDVEASGVAQVYQLAGALPQPARRDLRDLCVDYARSVVRDEWPAMRHGVRSQRTQDVVQKIWSFLNNLSRSDTDSVTRDHLLTTWTTVADQRRLRLLRTYTGLTGYAYALLIVGGVITLGLASIFTVDDIRSHVIKASALGSIITLMLVTIWGLDHPFSSEVRLQPTAFTRVLSGLPRN